ncbi:MAG: hypothetical protein AB9856_15430 [Cellulosilyticaceae bacterium]
MDKLIKSIFTKVLYKTICNTKQYMKFLEHNKWLDIDYVLGFNVKEEAHGTGY